MKLFKEDSVHYSRNIKIAFILSEVLVLCLFAISPHISIKEQKRVYFPENIITVADIPSTHIIPPKKNEMPPSKPAIVISFEPIEDPILPDVEIPDVSLTDNSISTSVGTSESKSKEYYASSFPFVPRQILEVVPSKIDGVSGYVKLSLKIGTDGFVKEYKIIAATINDEKIIKNILDAVYKSRWQPITIEGNKVEYWIDKTYSFN